MLVFRPECREKLVDRPHGHGVDPGDAHSAAAREFVHGVANRAASLPHHGGAGKVVLMHLQGGSKSPAAQRRLAQFRAEPRHLPGHHVWGADSHKEATIESSCNPRFRVLLAECW